MPTRIVNIRGRYHKVGLIPSTPERMLAAPSFHDRLRAGLHATPPPAVCINSVNCPWYDTGGNAPPDADDTTYTGQELGDCGVNSWAAVLAVLTSRYGGALARVWAKEIVAFYLQYTGGQDTGVNIDDFLTYCASTPIVDSTGKGWLAAPHSGISWTDQNAVMQCLSSPLFGAMSAGIDSSVYESAANSSNAGQICVVSGLKRSYRSYDHAVPYLDYGDAGALADGRKLTLNTNLINPNTFSVCGSSWGLSFLVEFASLGNFLGEDWATGLPAGVIVPPNGPAPVVPPVVPPSPVVPPTPAPTPLTHRGHAIAGHLIEEHKRDPAGVAAKIAAIEKIAKRTKFRAGDEFPAPAIPTIWENSMTLADWLARDYLIENGCDDQFAEEAYEYAAGVLACRPPQI
jgi:hypothetical protein